MRHFSPFQIDFPRWNAQTFNGALNALWSGTRTVGRNVDNPMLLYRLLKMTAPVVPVSEHGHGDYATEERRTNIKVGLAECSGNGQLVIGCSLQFERWTQSSHADI